MVLQKLVFPDCSIFEDALYYRGNRTHIAMIWEEHKIVSRSCYQPIKFNTYFNSFSYGKWKKYTRIKNLRLSLNIKGKCRVCLIRDELTRDGSDEYPLCSVLVDHKERATVELEYPACPGDSLLSFFIYPLSDLVEIYDGEYITDIEEAEIQEIDIALAICTFRREDYIARNMAMLKKHVFDNQYSVLHDHLRVYISDNGNTLDANSMDTPFVKLFPNKNSGGSGGFSRAAIEAMQDKSFNPSHIILMDDDIEFYIDTLEKNYSFLRILKPEYKISMIGGAMLRADKRWIQHAAGETYNLDGIVFNKADYNMASLVDVLRNEVEERINYLGWWYCCIPVSIFEKMQFSLPLFVQFDDIEFSLRNNDVPKITLNGICCWHIPFDKKWSGFKNYYTIRNRSIVNAIHFEKFNRKRFIRSVAGSSLKALARFNYNEANLVLLGGEDFLKGMSWLVKQDPAELNTQVISMSDKLADLDQLPVPFDSRSLKKNSDFYKVKRHTLRRLLTANGWFLPSNRIITVEVDNPPISYFNRAKTVLKYDINTGKGLVVEKDYHQAYMVLSRLMKLVVISRRSFSAAVSEYQNTKQEVTSKEFWKQFLGF